MASTPSYASTPRFGRAAISTADTSRTAPSSVGTVLSAAAAGTVLERVVLQATGTTTAGMLRLFVHDGTNYSLIKEVEVQAITPSASIKAWAVEIDMDGIVLPTGHSLRATTHNAEAFTVSAFGADLT
jgi:hypothetical protein